MNERKGKSKRGERIITNTPYNEERVLQNPPSLSFSFSVATVLLAYKYCISRKERNKRTRSGGWWKRERERKDGGEVKSTASGSRQTTPTLARLEYEDAATLR